MPGGKGPAILLGDGSYFDYMDPDASAMSISDVAYGLAYTCRFQGQTRIRATGKRAFYSVAEHCVRMAWEAPGEVAYDALMHDVGEVACGDMPTPLKSICPDYREIENRCEKAAFHRFGVKMRFPGIIKRLDLRMLATERRDITAWAGEDWSWCLPADMPEPFDDVIVPWAPDRAAEEFLHLYWKLRP